MKVSELMSKCVNCDYNRTRVTLRDGKRKEGRNEGTVYLGWLPLLYSSGI